MTNKVPTYEPLLPELPNPWGWRSLHNFIDAQRGICYGIVQPGAYVEDGIPIVRVKDIRDGRIDNSNLLTADSG